MLFDALTSSTAVNTLEERDFSERLVMPTTPEDEAELSRREQERELALSAIVSTIKDRYQAAKDARNTQESIWLDNYRLWRGEHTQEELARIKKAKERNPYASEVFVKVTKTKATAALASIQDIIFQNGKIPIGIEPTPEPQGAARIAYIAPESFPIEEATIDPYGFEGDGREIAPGSTGRTLLNGMYEKFKDLIGTGKVIQGASPDPTQMPQFSPAKEAAVEMERVIIDQMEEGDVQHEVRRMMWECVVLGTGILKGPMTVDSVTHSWEMDEESEEIVYRPRIQAMPKSFFTSCWNFYPDPSAQTVEDMEWCVERHLMTRSKVAQLKRRPFFNRNAIDVVLSARPYHEIESWENTIREVDQTFADDRYEVLEYWGYLERDHIAEVPSLLDALEDGVDQYHVNAWICNGHLLSVVINPFIPAKIPYHVVPYEEHEYQLWGIAIPENMKDSQILMNGHIRMMIDNLAYAGNCVFEINRANLSPNQDHSVYPGKIFYTEGGAMGQSVYSLQFNNTAQSHMMAYDKARQLADEVSGQPSYAHGGTATTGATRTASGMSMLMQAAAGNIKQVVSNFDEKLWKSLGQGYFAWNMQFNKKASIRGDIKIVAKGTAALMQREVRSQKLLQFLQVTMGNPATAPKVNIDYVLREFARVMDLDPDEMVNDNATALLVAQMMGAAGGQQQPQEEGVDGGVGGTDPSEQPGAGGTTAVGNAAMPGEQGFTGN